MGRLMTLSYIMGNILDASTEAVVVPVNCKGVSGAGLAKQFKREHPYWFMNYHTWCYEDKSGIGKLHLYLEMGTPKWIISFPTKKHWINPSHICYIICGLEELVEKIIQKKIRSIAIPKLGCGLGGLEWKDVNALFKEYLSNLDTDIYIYGVRPYSVPTVSNNY